MRVCKNCGKDIEHLRANAKFCSNAGHNNCKDLYHNKTTPRGFALRKRTTKRNYDVYGDNNTIGGSNFWND